MVTKTEIIKCPDCGSEKVTKGGHNATGKQVYKCKNPDCCRVNFVEIYSYNAYKPKVRKQVLEMAVNGVGTRATGRILKISKDTVTEILKKQNN